MIRGMTPPPMRTPVLPPEVQRLLNAQLQAGERVIWSSQPVPGLYARQAMPTAYAGIAIIAVAIGWIVVTHSIGSVVRRDDVPDRLPLLGVPIALVGIGLALSPLWVRRSAARAVYAVTDRRALVIRPRVFGAVEIESYQAGGLASMTRRQRADGAGDLIFEQFERHVGSGTVTTTVYRGFMGVADVKRVEELIAATLLADRVPAA